MKRDMRCVFYAAVAFLALAQILAEDLAVLGGYSLFVRRLFVCTGLFCDLFFTSQFLVGLYTASLNRKAQGYFFREGGWIDFLAAVPVLVLYSCPAVLGLAAGVPLVSGAARISSGLRFLRFLKLFRLSSFGAAERGAPAILVSVLIMAGSLSGPVFFRGGFSNSRIMDDYTASAFVLAQSPRDTLGSTVRDYAQTEGALLLVKQNATALYSRYDAAYYEKYYGQADYLWRRHRSLDFFFNLKPLLAEDARSHIAYFCVLAALFSALFLSSRIRARGEKP